MTQADGAARLAAVDLARGLALAGMMLVHLGSTRYFTTSLPAAELLGGRAASLFAVLAGVSLMLMYRRDPDGAGSVRATLVRSGLLIVLGLGLGGIAGVGVLVILAYYGVLFVLLLPFRGLSAVALFAIAAAWAVVAPIASFALRSALDPVVVRQLSFAELADPMGFVQQLFLSGGYPVGVWLAFGLLGLALGRLRLDRVAVGGTLLGVGAGLTVLTVGFAWLRGSSSEITQSWYGTVATTSWENLLILGSHSSTPVFVLSAAGSAMAVIGLSVLVVHGRLGDLGSRPIQWIGAMPLTLYTAHVLLVWLSGEHGFFLLSAGWPEWGAQLILFAAFAGLWRSAVGRGPLEHVVRVAAVPPR